MGTHHLHSRHRRKMAKVAVQLMRAGQYWASEMIDISATGVQLQRPDDWNGRLGQDFILDLVLRDDQTINLRAKVSRLNTDTVGLDYSYIPEESQGPLWEFLGVFADSHEASA